MRRNRLSLLGLAAGALVAFVSVSRSQTSQPAAGGAGGAAEAMLMDAAGKQVGTAMLTDEGGKLKLHVEVEGLTEGVHGIHIHEVGKCEGPDFKSAGAHFN